MQSAIFEEGLTVWYWTKKQYLADDGCRGFRQGKPAASFVVKLDKSELRVLRLSTRRYWSPGHAYIGHGRYLLREAIRQQADFMEDEGHGVGYLPRGWRL
jgi:hypothetical protein